MPPKRSNPPDVMTWGRAVPVLALCVVFDAFRFMFEWFVLFAPALGALFCSASFDFSFGSTALCSAGAAAIGTIGAGVITAFGVVMAMAVGLIGWLTIGIILFKWNPRIYAENALWFGASLLVSEVPLLGSIPALTTIVAKMYYTQIRVETAALKAWQTEQAAVAVVMRRKQEAELQAQIMDEAAREEVYAEEAQEEIIEKTDALSELHAKEEKTAEEEGKLTRAREIYENGRIAVHETDPVYRAAFHRSLKGEEFPADVRKRASALKRKIY